jgi:hypothetical protein
MSAEGELQLLRWPGAAAVRGKAPGRLLADAA